MNALVVNIKRSEAHNVYIGRSGHGMSGYFGNPVRTGSSPCVVCGRTHYDRLETIDCFEVYARRRLRRDAVYRERVKQLHGKRLGCFCAPRPCHGDVLVVLAAELNGEASETSGSSEEDLAAAVLADLEGSSHV